MNKRCYFLILPALVCTAWASAETATVAAATNFDATSREIVEAFENASGHEITLVTGASGKLFAQVVHGAPFDILLSADRLRPSRLAEQGHAMPGSQFTYARGRLTLWSQDVHALAMPADNEPNLQGLRTIAIANPDLAPYGLAAREVLQRMGQWQAVSEKVVMGENIGQTFAMVATRNAHGGFVASSALLQKDATSGSRWDVPPQYHPAIRQDAVLLAHGADNAAARAFMIFLAGPTARTIIRSHGYDIG